jgi:hypothetical protein
MGDQSASESSSGIKAPAEPERFSSLKFIFTKTANGALFLVPENAPCQANSSISRGLSIGGMESAFGMTIAGLDLRQFSLALRPLEVFMANETEIFYLVLLTLLVLIIHTALSIKARRRGRR